MRIYISGPITGDPGARWKFDQAAQIIADRGHDYINPARLADTIPNAGWDYYIALDLQMLKQADAIVQLPGWEKSPGAKKEHEAALESGLAEYNIETGEFRPLT